MISAAPIAYPPVMSATVPDDSKSPAPLTFYFVCANLSCDWRGSWSSDSGQPWPPGQGCPACTRRGLKGKAVGKLRPVRPPSTEAQADPSNPWGASL